MNNKKLKSKIKDIIFYTNDIIWSESDIPQNYRTYQQLEFFLKKSEKYYNIASQI